MAAASPSIPGCSLSVPINLHILPLCREKPAQDQPGLDAAPGAQETADAEDQDPLPRDRDGNQRAEGGDGHSERSSWALTPSTRDSTLSANSSPTLCSRVNSLLAHPVSPLVTARPAQPCPWPVTAAPGRLPLCSLQQQGLRLPRHLAQGSSRPCTAGPGGVTMGASLSWVPGPGGLGFAGGV